jgi:hypothetical protein
LVFRKVQPHRHISTIFDAIITIMHCATHCNISKSRHYAKIPHHTHSTCFSLHQKTKQKFTTPRLNSSNASWKKYKKKICIRRHFRIVNLLLHDQSVLS